ncbi:MULTISPECIES: DUF3040 domain-containing protein [Streptomyces]|uniref:DUF3040 domain-containing protein n=1 Tax=Streptomyces TaxID=1883 RepID=UPI001315D18A|nr:MULTISPECIES: DUF3040 domain-containing protein [Streptomyces]QGZ47516.1 DUF3040 domain-containing protein [Streptomyces sp. QHH-9511]GGT78993.1 hypothetical protein GCM10010272_23510 [Streptomyces lateritius]
MDETPLSQHERRVLAEIEDALREDALLERRLRTMRRGGLGHAVRKGPGRGPGEGRTRKGRHGVRGRLAALGVTLLGMLTLALLVLAVATGEPALTWAFAAAWVLTLSCLLRLVVRWSRRLASRSSGSP